MDETEVTARLVERLPEVIWRILGEPVREITLQTVAEERIDVSADGVPAGSLPLPLRLKEISLVIGTTSLVVRRLFERPALRRLARFQMCALDGLVTVAALDAILGVGYALWWLKEVRRDDRSHVRRVRIGGRREWDNMAKTILLAHARDLDALVKERDHPRMRNARLFWETPREIDPVEVEARAMDVLRWLKRTTP